MYLPSYMEMDFSRVVPQPSELIRGDIDEAAQEVAEAHKALRLLATFYCAEDKARAKLEEAMRALEHASFVVGAIQEAASKAEAE